MQSTMLTTSTADRHSPLRSDEERKFAQSILMDVLIFVVLLIPVAICEFAIEPFRRGFFCDDESIRYPFRGNTVTPVLLGLIVGLLPVLAIIVVDFLRFYQRGRMSDSQFICGWKTPAWLLECSKQIAFLCFGVLLTFDATEVGKYTIGRLRPHFIAVCQPAFGDGSTCDSPQNAHRYMENYICVADGFSIADVRQARLSFPSGHSSLVVFAMTYLAIYLQYKMTWRGSKLTRHFLQFLLLMLAWFTALSRVMDSWHHWSDVLIGSLIGVTCALITAHCIAKFSLSTKKAQLGEANLKISIPRQDTTTTLQEMISSTPPPYTLNGDSETINSFSNEQYCTKV